MAGGLFESIRVRLLLLVLGALIPAFTAVLLTERTLFHIRQAEITENALRSARLAGESQRVLTRDGTSGADLRTIVDQTLKPFLDLNGDRFIVDGPTVALDPRQTRALALTLHELCTNAIKYGALSNQEGTVSISWNRVAGPDGEQQIEFCWKERGGPPVSRGDRKGFGTRLIQSCEKDLGSIRLEYDPEGVTCVIRTLATQ